MSQWQPIASIASDVRAGRASATELVKKSLKLIKENQEYGAIITTTAERALARAKEIDKNPKGKLAGVPFIAKDNFLAFGSETTAGSNMLKGFVAPYQATVVERLEAEGAICVAKANMDAFAHGSSTENSDFFATKNPRDKTRVPGGSSGGSAAAVVLELAPFAIGTDTGGSIRLPASFSGCVGYKPTYGLVSRSGVVAMASSCDCPGPLTRTVEDAELVMDVIAGQDKLDGTTIDKNPEGYITNKANLGALKIGVVKEYVEASSIEVGRVVGAALDKLAKAGASIKTISLPSVELSLPAYYIIVPAEVASNLARYDGQRFPFSFKEAKTLEESYLKSRSFGFGKEAKRRIIIGTFVLSSGYYDAYYQKATEVRLKIIDEFETAFKEYDLLAGPTAGITAFPIGQVRDPLEMYKTDVMTAASNLAGIPAISLPAGVADNNLPVGLQLMATRGHDRELLAAAEATEELFK